jgi:hypothetical protein
MKHLVCIDFESYYDKDYSLAKMPTHQYIRDSRWKCLGCGFQFDDEKPFYVEDPEPVFRKIDAIGWENVTAVAHNAAFDGSVLFERYGRRKPGMWIDTQLIARWAVAQGHLSPDQAVGLAKLAPLVGLKKGDTWEATQTGGQALHDYGVQDVTIEMALLRHFMKYYRPPVDELTYMDMHVRMNTEPRLCLDEPKLHQATIITPQMEAMNKALRKDANMVQLLEHYGVEVEYKTTPKGKTKPALAKTDDFMQSLATHEDSRVAELASLRLGANSNITRTRAITLLAVGEPLPFPVLYYGAHTGRASGVDNYNMQNMPAGGVLRQSIRAPEGYKLVAGDSRQVEARTVGWRAGDQRLLETFRTSDPYCTFGAQYMYGCAADGLSDDQRKIAKAGLLGLGFAQGWRGLIAGSKRQRLVIPEDMARAAVNGYRGGFDRVPVWWQRLKRWALEDGYVELPDGRRITYPDLREEEGEDGKLQLVYDRPLIFSKGPKGKRQTVRFWHGLACENDTQASARSVVFWQAAGMRRDGLPIVGMSHDEAISMVPDNEVADAEVCMKDWLSRTPPWAEGLPVEGEVNYGNNYAECK